MAHPQRETLSLSKPSSKPAVTPATPEQIAEFLKQHGLIVMPRGATAPTPAEQTDWRYDAPVAAQHADTSHIPPVGERNSNPLQIPPRTWGNPNWLRSDPRPGPQPGVF